MAVAGYLEYGVAGSAAETPPSGARKQKDKRKREQRDSTNDTGARKGWSVMPDHAKKAVVVTQGGEARGTYAFEKLNEHATEGRRSCLRGLVIAGLRAANTINAETAEKIKCTKCSHAAAAKSHAWKEGARLSACKVKRGAAPDAQDSTTMVAKPEGAKKRKPKAAEPEAQQDEAEMSDEEEAESSAEDAGSGEPAEEDAGDTTASEGGSPMPKRNKQRPNAKPAAGKAKGKTFRRR